ncbi:adenine DNA glycosylase [Patella vulgata]|uniref:adenine DNA glycosylase n=1 Tax=Patella vulgata TaxID=6465 RepID=UPI00217FC144|nr:adenine DNA glycosylase [Patella vulgata]
MPKPKNRTTVKVTKEDKTNKKDKTSNICRKISPVHDFDEEEIKKIRLNLVEWYQCNKRDLPWRKLATDPDINKRSYSVWVSEVMLQQTQVATVIDYYNKWIKKWPTLVDLAKASLEEVNEMWSGLGYYSRGRRLQEGAKKVVEELGGEMPRNAEDLLNELAGVGRYTAGAIASIAYNQVTGLVDGNVIRVLSRLRLIGADSTSHTCMDVYWHHANKLVDVDQPGDFNQGLMELGATVCTPKTPNCSVCPLQKYCKAYSQVEVHKTDNASKLLSDVTKNGKIKMAEISDIECLVEDCSLCFDKTETWDPSMGVMNYPRKVKKKAAREERTVVCIISRTDSDNNLEYLITQRPQKGLLAGLWEFPSQLITDESCDITDTLNTKYGIVLSGDCKRLKVGEVVHIFSHIHQTYVVESITLTDHIKDKTNQDDVRWVTKDDFLQSAISTAMKKVFKAYEKSSDSSASFNKGLKRKRGKSQDTADSKKQTSLNSFFIKQ